MLTAYLPDFLPIIFFLRIIVRTLYLIFTQALAKIPTCIENSYMYINKYAYIHDSHVSQPLSICICMCTICIPHIVHVCHVCYTLHVVYTVDTAVFTLRKLLATGNFLQGR